MNKYRANELSIELTHRCSADCIFCSSNVVCVSSQCDNEKKCG